MPAENGVSFQFLAENSSDIVCRAGADGVLHYVSPSSLHVLGWKPEEMTGRISGDFILTESASFLPDKPLPNMDGSPITVRMRKKDETIAWVEIKHRVVCDPVTGDSAETVIVMRDITRCKHLEQELSLLELTDTRTGLSTHRAFDEILEREWNRSVRDHSDLSLVLLDFDHFRQFHDWRQHREGDRCLGKAASAVLGSVRITDYAARYGAEDIAIILPSTGSAGAAHVAEKIQFAIQALRSDPFESGQRQGRLTVSIGSATALAPLKVTARMPEILRLGADNALQKAKAARSAWLNESLAAPLAIPGKAGQENGSTDKP